MAVKKLPFLLEIGSEEIPDWMIPSALEQLKSLFEDLLAQNRLGGKVTSVDATPRRLVLNAEKIIERQPDAEEIVSGPPKSAGDGAAMGFARKMGVDIAQLEVVSTPKGEYFSFKKQLPGRAASEILAEALPGLVLKINWPKTMYWTGKGGPRFIRPIRWIVALLGKDVVPFEIAGVPSGNLTNGHRRLGKTGIKVSISNHSEKLRQNHVLLSAAERRQRIEAGIAELLAGSDLQIKADEKLLHTLVYITEFPTPILGGFDEQYLALPSEVLVTVMRHHQKYFSVETADGKLAPHFIAVMNTSGDPEGLVRKGNERVLARAF